MQLTTAKDITSVLSEEIQKLRDGKTTAANLNAITNATGKVITLVKLEIQCAKECGLKPSTGFFNRLPAPKKVEKIDG